NVLHFDAGVGARVDRLVVRTAAGGRVGGEPLWRAAILRAIETAADAALAGEVGRGRGARARLAEGRRLIGLFAAELLADRAASGKAGERLAHAHRVLPAQLAAGNCDARRGLERQRSPDGVRL